jgi:hypothetical protein
MSSIRVKPTVLFILPITNKVNKTFSEIWPESLWTIESTLHGLLNQHCFVCRPSDTTMSENAGNEPRTVATLALDQKLYPLSYKSDLEFEDLTVSGIKIIAVFCCIALYLRLTGVTD